MNASTTTDVMTCRRRRAERPQQRQLARPLRDDDRERVEDDERRPRTGRSNAKTSSAVRKKPSPSFSAWDCSSATDVRRDRLDPVGQHRLRPTLWSSRRGDTFVADDADRVVDALLAEHSLRRRRVERPPAWRPPRLSASPNPAIPTIVNSPGRPLEQDRGSVADREVGVARRRGVDHDLVGAGRRHALAAQRQDLVGQLVPVRADRRRADAADRLVGRGVDHLGVALHVADGDRDAVDAAARRRAPTPGSGSRSSLPPPPPGPAAAESNAESDRTTTSDAARGLREQLVERRVHRVGEHVGARDEPHAQHDRERRSARGGASSRAGS